MVQDRAVVIFEIVRKNGNVERVDIDIPLTISANELVIGLNEAYGLGINRDNIRNCFLKSEYPIALLRGSKLLADYHIMNGTKLRFVEGE